MMAFHSQTERLSCQEVMNRPNSYASAFHEVSLNRCKYHLTCGYTAFVKNIKKNNKLQYTIGGYFLFIRTQSYAPKIKCQG